jgi:UDP-N-acetylmuramoylalanine--D-glutamate ligase
MTEAFEQAHGLARPGDAILLSPGAASFGGFRNEFDRGEQFVALVQNLEAHPSEASR